MMVRQAHHHPERSREMKHIALIAGQGRLPLIFADEARKKGERVIGIGIKGISPEGLDLHVDKSYWGEITQTKRALEVLKLENIDHVVMTGKIPKAIIFDRGLKLNKEASEIFQNTVDSKDYTIIKAIAARFKREGIRILDPTSYFSNLLPQKGLLAKRPPTKEEWEDIRFGVKIAKRIAGMDIGQAVVVKKKSILAIEAIEGTDSAIRRAGELNGDGAVVVKVARPRQDMRFDIPTIGPETIDSLIDAKAKVLAIEAKKTLVVDKDEIVKKADAAGIAVVAI